MRTVKIPSPNSRFLKVKCLACKSEQVVFGSASTLVQCVACNKTLVAPTGGKAKITAKILQVLG